jgi:outer membrane protein OmpA-like peptidoglycan-associated protein
MAKQLSAIFVAILLAASPSLAWIPPPDETSFMVFFEPAQAELPPPAIETLAQVLKAISQRYDGPVRLSGHTDLNEGQFSLSTERAMAVKEKLQQLGVRPERISIESWGSERPLAINKPGIPEAENRRVVIYIERLCKGSCPPEQFQDAAHD